MVMRARLLDEHLKTDVSMARLAVHASHLQKLQQILEKYLPSMLARSCRVANFKLGTVIIHAENGAIAAKLRQMAPRMSAAFQREGEQVAEIRIKVQPLEISPEHKHQPQAAVLGEDSRARLDHLADTLPDGPLKAALEKLVLHSRPR